HAPSARRRARHRPGPPHRGAGRTSHRDPAQGHTQLDRLAVAGFGPSWVGVNPLSGKAQALWLIDPVYAAKDRRSSNMALLAVATDELNVALGGDRSFSHRFSRWPLHRSGDPTAYRWHCQHHQVVRLRDLIDYLRE